jgi:addiction module RelB/DinJ family antitoxin
MAKTNNLHIRIDPKIQHRADKVLKGLGMSIPDAVTVFLNQVSLEGGIPFQIKHPPKINNPLKKKGNYGDKGYFLGVYMDDFAYAPDEWLMGFRKRLTPEFGKATDEWLEQAKLKEREQNNGEWKEPFCWLSIFRDAKSGGSFDAFENLFKEKGLRLTRCDSNRQECGPCPPYVLGFSLKKVDERLVFNGQKPQMYQELVKKLLAVFSKLEEEELEVFEVFDEETEGLFSNIYDPNDPNFMCKDDY